MNYCDHCGISSDEACARCAAQPSLFEHFEFNGQWVPAPFSTHFYYDEGEPMGHRAPTRIEYECGICAKRRRVLGRVIPSINGIARL